VEPAREPGGPLVGVRRHHELTQAEPAETAQLSTSGIRRIEAGTRRTRRSTLDRIAAALGNPALADELPKLAGLASPVNRPNAERIARRRARRHGRSRAASEAAAKGGERRSAVDMLGELERSGGLDDSTPRRTTLASAASDRSGFRARPAAGGKASPA
jgi:transcriptional regulator with XRE-family HTH domain